MVSTTRRSFRLLTKIDRIEEPTVAAQIIVPKGYVSRIIDLAKQRRGVFHTNDYHCGNDRLNLTFTLPLAEILYDFYDQLKTLSRGLASFDYHFSAFRRL